MLHDYGKCGEYVLNLSDGVGRKGTNWEYKQEKWKHNYKYALSNYKQSSIKPQKHSHKPNWCDGVCLSEFSLYHIAMLMTGADCALK